MGFKPGTQLRLDNALKILMVKSANDVAATVAENLGGSVEGFAELMNQQAARLGMRDSHFANPHGLPDERNQTTASDMAILARALINEFPDYQELFRHRRDPIWPPDHAQHEWPDRPLSGRRRHEDRLYLLGGDSMSWPARPATVGISSRW